MVVSAGEQVTTALLAMALNKRGVKAKSYNGSQVRILTDDAHTKARIKEIDDRRLHADLDAGYTIVVAGFQGCDPDGNITTLGRGGSDTSAVAVAAAMVFVLLPVVERLTRVRGIGRWTAEMFLMFNLGRPDVMPATDLGVQKGVQAVYRMRKLPEPEQVLRRTRHLAPYRSAASWYFWRAADTVLMG